MSNQPEATFCLDHFTCSTDVFSRGLEEEVIPTEPLTLEQLKGRRQAFRNVRLDLARRVQKDFDLPTIPFHNRHTERKFWKTEYLNLTNNQTTK